MKRSFSSIILLILSLAASTALQARKFEKSVTFPAGATLEEKVAMAADLVPAKRQIEWQKLELTAFLHFGINTFTGREWGDGKENPMLFNPSNLDADQWVSTLKRAGFKMVILTAKHHDGFCLWQTATTAHSVASSAWRNGKGDVVRDLRKACDRYGMKLGIYLSPWDRNAECYGDSPRYNDMLVAQLTELLTNYGRIDEVWFDGACGEGPNGRRQQYDWQRFSEVIRRLQPDAVTAIMGDDVRWVGNERGMGRTTEWSATAITPGIYPDAEKENEQLGLFAKAPDLGSRDIIARAKRLFWWPSEVDVSIRKGWFFHHDQQPKSLRELADIYLNSVGRNSVLLLNVPPDTDGRINKADSIRLMELRRWIDASFADNRIASRKGTVGRFAKPSMVNAVTLSEDISKGQRIERFSIEALTTQGNWTEIASGTTVGLKRIITFNEIEARAIRVNILMSRGKVHLSAIKAHHLQPIADVAESNSLYKSLNKEGWKVTDVPGGTLADAATIIDGNDSTTYTSHRVSFPADIVIDMRATTQIAGFVYTPAHDAGGAIFRYAFSTSTDGKLFTPCGVTGEFGNIANNPIPQRVIFDNPATARFVKLTALSECSGADSITIAEFDILAKADIIEPKDNERAVYDNPAAPLSLKPGDAHPTVDGWNFYTAHEFLDRDIDNGHRPLGWKAQNTPHMSRSARIDIDRCAEVRNGVLHLTSHQEPDSIDNGFGKRVKYSSFALRTVADDSPEAWCRFTENMRIEVRCRRSDHKGLNDALWFMGNSGQWPENGEIDLLENPKRTINHRSHFTLHSANHYAGVVGGKGSTTASIDLSDMKRWNIFWIEWYADMIVGGVNGQTYFVHHRGDNGNTDWPWSNPAGFFMLISSGLSDRPEAWPGHVDASQLTENNQQFMDIDWIRVYTRKGTTQPAPKVRFH